ncbi:MAG: hypothetical protein JWO57_2464 [Pseudonocardiales bacterium]|nr:hypothetical protein [Pseudonocardiales bacterium]
MKRVLLTIAGTVVGLVALLSFKSQSHPLSTAGALPSAGLPATSTPSTPKTPATTGGSPKPGSTGSATPSTATAKRTIAGDAIDTQYGVVQVQVVVSGSKIDNVSLLQLTAYDGRSQEINTAAAPILLQETISAQSANINSVSGASYTSQGYMQSLQSALDKAGIK